MAETTNGAAPAQNAERGESAGSDVGAGGADGAGGAGASGAGGADGAGAGGAGRAGRAIHGDEEGGVGATGGPGPAASPRRRSPAKRDAILRAALTVFLREGFAGASVDTVAATAGVGKQTVYAHFGDKEKLFLAAAQAAQTSAGLLGDTPEAWPSPLPSTGDPRADLTAAGVRVLRAVLAPDAAALHRMTIAELARHPELQRLWRDNASRQTIDDIAGYLADRDAAGDLDVPEPARAARQFVLLLATEGRVRTLHGTQPLPEAEYARIAAETADLILRAHRRT
ncbi:TetR/AcrR family transcriptional regulator [Streptomyces sp. CA-111067]|uniref:TetR/AcrR family transcriptional regulator n=1 Tax=Streptomyces sp. CA-111067 TaxID=3240046 RepID=UPI003D955539